MEGLFKRLLLLPLIISISSQRQHGLQEGRPRVLQSSDEQGSSESWGLQEGITEQADTAEAGGCSSTVGPARTRRGSLLGHLLAEGRWAIYVPLFASVSPTAKWG